MGTSFVHFTDTEKATAAMQALNGVEVAGGIKLRISYGKRPGERTRGGRGEDRVRRSDQRRDGYRASLSEKYEELSDHQQPDAGWRGYSN
jgi:hypothetical protein